MSQLQPDVAALLDAYAGDLAQCVPSSGLDASMAALIATPTGKRSGRARVRTPFPRWVLTVSLAGLALSVGMLVGFRAGKQGPDAVPVSGPGQAKEAPKSRDPQPVAKAPADVNRR